MSAAPAIDGARLLARLAELRGIGATPLGGVTREAFSAADVAARDLAATWMRDAGLTVTVDAAANLIGRRAGESGRWIASGSHLDTVIDGGWLDGAYGVVAAIEVATVLRERSQPLGHGFAAVAFSNEEGARGTPGMTGSRAVATGLEPGELDDPDDDGLPLRDRIASAGGDPGAIASAQWDPATIAAFVELHVEQGPVMDASGTTLGVVTGISGRQAVTIEVRGRANHAGTTPMALRHDALTGGAEVVLAIEDLGRRQIVRVATCGHLLAQPNVHNVVPGSVVVGAELRDENSGRLDAAMVVVDDVVSRIAASRAVTIDVSWGQRVAPIPASPDVTRAIEAAIASVDPAWSTLASGAGHDAQIMGSSVPMGMIFVPSIAGISHSPREHTDPGHLVVGAQALLDTVLALDSGGHP